MKTVSFHRPDGKKLRIEIFKYKPEDVSRNRTPDRHRHDFHSIIFVLKGSSRQEIDFEEYILNSNEVIIIPAGAIHWEKENKDLSAYMILFTDDFFSNPQKELLNGLLHYAMARQKLSMSLNTTQVKNIELYFKLLMQEQVDESQNQTFILQNLMLALVNKLEGIIQNQKEENSFVQFRRPFQRFIELVESHYLDQNKLDYYVEKLNITKRKLNETVKLMTGQTANNYIINRIILEAKRELIFGERSIKEIAHHLGYDNQYYFSRIFKNKVEYSPEQFRKLFAE